MCAGSFDRMKNTHSAETKEYSLRKNSCYSTSHNMQLTSWVTNSVSIAMSLCWVTSLAFHGCVGFCSILPARGVGSIHAALRQHQESSQRSLLATVCWVLLLASFMVPLPPTRTKCSTGIKFVSQQGSEPIPTAKHDSAPSDLNPGSASPWRRSGLSPHSQHLCPPGDSSSHFMDIPEPDTELKAVPGHVPGTAHLVVISPSASQGHAEPITAFPQRLAMSQLDKNTIKLVPEFSPSQLFRLVAEPHKKINETVFDKSIFCLLSNAGSSCRSCMPRRKRMVHTLPWQLLTTAGAAGSTSHAQLPAALLG